MSKLRKKNFSKVNSKLLIFLAFFVIGVGILFYLVSKQKSSADIGSMIISNIKIENITETSADVSWITNIPAYGGVGFGPTDRFVNANYGDIIHSLEENKILSYNHRVKVDLSTWVRSGQGPNFGLIIFSKNFIFKSGQEYRAYTDPNVKDPKYSESSSYFITASSKDYPIIYNIRHKFNANHTSVTIFWNTNKSARGRVKFYPYSPDAREVAGQTLTKNFGLTVDNLDPGKKGADNYKVFAKDAAGQETSSSGQVLLY